MRSGDSSIPSHEAYYEFDGSEYVAYCRCGFYRCCESQEVAEAEFRNHLEVGR